MTTSASPSDPLLDPLPDPLPSQYRSKQAFLASLPPWRRRLAKLNWHPIIDLQVQRYAIEQNERDHKQRLNQIKSDSEQIKNDIERLEKENARLAAINSRLARFEREHFSNSTPPQR